MACRPARCQTRNTPLDNQSRGYAMGLWVWLIVKRDKNRKAVCSSFLVIASLDTNFTS